MTGVGQAVIQPRGSNPLLALALCLIGAAIVSTVPFTDHVYLYTLVSLLFVCVVVPLWYSWARGHLDYFEPIHVIGGIYFIYFGLGAIWTAQDPSEVAYDLYIVPYLPRAVLYCLLGYLAMLAGYYAPWTRLRESTTLERPRGVLFLLAVGGLGILGYQAVRIAERAAALGFALPALVGSLSQLSPLFLFAWALGWLLFFSKTDTWPQRLVLLGFLLPGGLMTASATFSDKSLIMTLVGIPIISRWYAVKRVPWTFLIVLLLVLMFVIFPFYNTYRWSDPNMDQTMRLTTTVSTLQTWDSDRYLRFSIGAFKSRLAMINSVAIVIRDVGRWEPFAKGETLFMPVLVFFVPRVLWPEKPTTSLGKEFGRRFRVTDWRNAEVFIGVTAPGELYWNFHLPGILIGMALMGFGVRFLYRRYGESRGFDPMSKAIHILLLVKLSHLIGGAMAPGLVSLVRTVMVIEFMRWVGRNMGIIEVLSTEPVRTVESEPSTLEGTSPTR